MTENAVQGALLKCSSGVAPSTLNVLPSSRVTVEGRPAACVTDTATGLNIPPFGMCTTLANPAVAAATSATFGVLTPMPCVPVVVGPWTPGAAKTHIGGIPALVSGSTCSCAWGGIISMLMPGAVRTSST
jgi:uncharacterized Zn-binding protein involved in type VI secretion